MDRIPNRNRGPPFPHKNSPHSHPHPHPGRLPPPLQVHEHPFEPPFRGRDMGPHPHLLEERERNRERERALDSRFGIPGRPPHPAILEDRLNTQLEEIESMLIDNQRVAATHVALKQELEETHFHLNRLSQLKSNLHPEKDLEMREVFEKAKKLERELQSVEVMKGELGRLQGDIKELTVARQEMMAQVQGMSVELGRVTADLQQVPALKAEIEVKRQEIERAKAAIEYEKKVYADSYAQGQMLQGNLVTMSRELEKVRAEIANAEKRARASAAAVAVSNPGIAANASGYHGNYGATPEAGYAVNPYPVASGMNPMQSGMENYAQYIPAPGNWNAYNAQHPQGHR